MDYDDDDYYDSGTGYNPGIPPAMFGNPNAPNNNNNFVPPSTPPALYGGGITPSGLPTTTTTIHHHQDAFMNPNYTVYHQQQPPQEYPPYRTPTPSRNSAASGGMPSPVRPEDTSHDSRAPSSSYAQQPQPQTVTPLRGISAVRQDPSIDNAFFNGPTPVKGPLPLPFSTMTDSNPNNNNNNNTSTASSAMVSLRHQQPENWKTPSIRSEIQTPSHESRPAPSSTLPAAPPMFRFMFDATPPRGGSGGPSAQDVSLPSNRSNPGPVNVNPYPTSGTSSRRGGAPLAAHTPPLLQGGSVASSVAAPDTSHDRVPQHHHSSSSSNPHSGYLNTPSDRPLSSNPTPIFPRAVLHKGILLRHEVPQGDVPPPRWAPPSLNSATLRPLLMELPSVQEQLARLEGETGFLDEAVLQLTVALQPWLSLCNGEARYFTLEVKRTAARYVCLAGLHLKSLRVLCGNQLERVAVRLSGNGQLLQFVEVTKPKAEVDGMHYLLNNPLRSTRVLFNCDVKDVVMIDLSVLLTMPYFILSAN